MSRYGFGQPYGSSRRSREDAREVAKRAERQEIHDRIDPIVIGILNDLNESLGIGGNVSARGISSSYTSYRSDGFGLGATASSTFYWIVEVDLDTRIPQWPTLWVRFHSRNGDWGQSVGGSD